MKSVRFTHPTILGLTFAGLFTAGVVADRAFGWVAPAFDFVAHLFYEIPQLAEIRRPSQLALVRAHVLIWGGLVAIGLLASGWLSRHARWWWAVFCTGYALRAIIWIVGGNLPLVPGDSCHYVEVATSVARGEGPVKHYVESFFIDYPAIREGRGVLDDWATPLFAYVLAGAYRITGVEPGASLESTIAVAKGTSFVLNLFCLPVLYIFTRRRYGPDTALWTMAALAVLPVHVIYAGFGLRESLVALTSILAVWTLTEVWSDAPRRRWAWAIVAGLCGGLAILARNTAMALMAASGLYALVAHGRRHLGPLLVVGVVMAAVIAPWAWATRVEYGEPFYTYTKYFQYTFSWTVHHYEAGTPSASDFYTWDNAPEIVRVKIKSLLIIVVVSFMILSFPLALGFVHRLVWPGPNATPPSRDIDRLVLLIGVTFVVATLANIADVTQVAQLGRYYMPLFVLMLPPAVAGLRDWLNASVAAGKHSRIAAGTVLLLWADPTWAYDATWLVKPYQLHWPALRAAGDFVREHPELVPDDARVMTWFPWEFRLASQRTTVLMPRSYYPPHLERVRQQYGVTHVLWGSFEPPPHVDPETWGPYLEQVRLALGLTDRREIYRSPPRTLYPVRLYRLTTSPGPSAGRP